jgi:hypothetical protein
MQLFMRVTQGAQAYAVPFQAAAFPYVQLLHVIELEQFVQLGMAEEQSEQ